MDMGSPQYWRRHLEQVDLGPRHSEAELIEDITLYLYYVHRRRFGSGTAVDDATVVDTIIDQFTSKWARDPAWFHEWSILQSQKPQVSSLAGLTAWLGSPG